MKKLGEAGETGGGGGRRRSLGLKRANSWTEHMGWHRRGSRDRIGEVGAPAFGRRRHSGLGDETAWEYLPTHLFLDPDQS